jgi:hypothetical protein
VEATSFKPSLPRAELSGANTLAAEQIHSVVEAVLATTQCIDMHTHLFPPSFGELGLWGIEDLLTYHYLEAEFFRSSDAGAVRVASYCGPGGRDLASSIRCQCPDFGSYTRNCRRPQSL